MLLESHFDHVLAYPELELVVLIVVLYYGVHPDRLEEWGADEEVGKQLVSLEDGLQLVVDLLSNDL